MLEGAYNVIYSDGTEGAEYFDGNTWQIEYEHPVKYWKFNCR